MLPDVNNIPTGNFIWFSWFFSCVLRWNYKSCVRGVFKYLSSEKEQLQTKMRGIFQVDNTAYVHNQSFAHYFIFP